ncbi:MAG: TIM44-like domain-containing protein [Pirellulaceae bacterium]|nr:TIM44-like domain-containing protein [Pirellulaceae bacterium]
MDFLKPQMGSSSRFGPRAARTLALLLLACVVIGLLLAPAWGWDRAGGGGGYSGGSYTSGGGDGGGGDGMGDLLFLLIWLCVEHPVIGIPLLIVVVIFMIVSGQKGRQAARGQVIHRGSLALTEQRRMAAVDRLRADDPTFDDARFCDRVAQAFHKIQAAWSAQDLTSVRAFISDGIYERFSLQGIEQREFGYRPRVENVVVRKMLLAQVSQDPFFDLVTVRIEASCVAYRVSLADGRYVSGSRTPEVFAEYWSFLRRRGVRTQETPGLIEGNCPNCGADIALNQHARCKSCDSLLRSGQFDWVLSEITQECEWVEAPPERIPGVERYRAERDPGFNVQHLEDLASVVFWRKAKADREGNVDALRKVAVPEFLAEYERALTAGEAGRAYWGDCAVGSVETRGVLAASPADNQPLDRVLVELRWSGSRFERLPNGPPQRTELKSAFHHLYVFVRRPGVKTDVSQSVSSSHCPLCGAPEMDLTTNACGFCGEVLNDGAHDWNLAQVLLSAGSDARELIHQAYQRGQGANAEPITAEAVGPAHAAAAADHSPHGTALLEWAITMALADHELDRRERAMIERVARYRHVPPPRVEALIETARRGELLAPEPASDEQARQWLTAMADISLADGSLHAAEMRLLTQVGERLNMSVYDVKSLIKQRQTELYRAARARLKHNGR